MLIDRVRRYCLNFPSVHESLQWGDVLCFKIANKIFAMIGLDRVPQTICCKCDASDFAELTEREGISAAPYVGRFGWVELGLDLLPTRELEGLIERSYLLVAAKARTSSPRRAGPRGRAKKPGRGGRI